MLIYIVFVIVFMFYWPLAHFFSDHEKLQMKWPLKVGSFVTANKKQIKWPHSNVCNFTPATPVTLFPNPRYDEFRMILCWPKKCETSKDCESSNFRLWTLSRIKKNVIFWYCICRYTYCDYKQMRSAGDKIRSSTKTSSYTKILGLNDTQKALESGVSELTHCKCSMLELSSF